jgi:hypothetical protein
MNQPGSHALCAAETGIFLQRLEYRALAGVSFPQATFRMTGPVLAVRRADVGQERVRS